MRARFFLNDGVALKSHRRYHSFLYCFLAVISLLVVIIEKPLAENAPAKTTPMAEKLRDSSSHRIAIYIAALDSLHSGQFDTLEMTLDAVGQQVAGFSLKIASTSEGLEIVQIVQGGLLDSCGWELFSATPLVQDVNRPNAVWRISGLAKMSADTIEPSCLASGKRGSIARIIVTSSHASGGSEPMPVFFFWEDCRDNTVSDEGGRQLYVSDRVIDYVPIDFPASKQPFPNRIGAPPGCISPRSSNAPKRLIEFHNGGVSNTTTSTE